MKLPKKQWPHLQHYDDTWEAWLRLAGHRGEWWLKLAACILAILFILATVWCRASS